MLLSQLIEPVPDPFCTPWLISCRSNEKISVSWLLLESSRSLSKSSFNNVGGPNRLSFLWAPSIAYLSSNKISRQRLWTSFGVSSKRYTVWHFPAGEMNISSPSSNNGGVGGGGVTNTLGTMFVVASEYIARSCRRWPLPILKCDDGVFILSCAKTFKVAIAFCPVSPQ